MNEVPTPEQAVAYLMAEKIQSWVDELPKWRDMPEIKESEANFKRTVAATQIAKAVGRLMRSTFEVLNADIDCVLGHQARTSLELFFDAAWLRMNDNDGRLCEQFATWQTNALYEAKGRPEHGKPTIQKAWNVYDSRLSKSPDEWTVIEGQREVTNANNRRNEVTRKLAEKPGLEGLPVETGKMFRALNTLSHGVNATARGGETDLTPIILKGCYLTIQECQYWLLEMTGGFPDEESKSAADELGELAKLCP